MDGHRRLDQRDALIADITPQPNLMMTHSFRCKASHGDKAINVKEYCYDNDIMLYYDDILELIIYSENVKNEYEFKKQVEYAAEMRKR